MEISDKELWAAIRLLAVATRYESKDPLDTDEEDMLRWGTEGGRPSEQ